LKSYWFITAVTRTRHLSLSCARTIQSMPLHHFLNIYFNIILPSRPRSSNSLLKFSPPKPCIHLFSPPCVLYIPAFSFFFTLHMHFQVNKAPEDILNLNLHRSRPHLSITKANLANGPEKYRKSSPSSTSH
jgi:hypothetical protein